jgi:FkbM family methyltransferase
VNHPAFNQTQKRSLRTRIRAALTAPGPLGRHSWENAIYRTLILSRLLRLTTSRTSQLWLAVVWLALTLKEKLGVLGQASFRVIYEFDGHRIAHRVWDRSELDVMTEVFVSREYELAADQDARVVLDLGSNIGLSILYFHLRCPEAVIVGVEPDPETFRRLEVNTAHLPRVRLVNAAVAAQAGVVQLYSSGRSWETSLYPRDHLLTRTQVVARTADDVMSSLGLTRADVIKVDIEGAEVEVLPTAKIVRSARAIVFEYHAEYADVTVFDLIATLSGFSVKRIEGSSAAHALVTLRREAEE